MKKNRQPNYFLINCANQKQIRVPVKSDRVAFYNVESSKLEELHFGRMVIKNPLNIRHWAESQIDYDGYTFEVKVEELSSSINTNLSRWHEYHPVRAVVNLPPRASTVG